MYKGEVEGKPRDWIKAKKIRNVGEEVKIMTCIQQDY